ncbi:MAG: hypothetical protein QM723_09055 [Myxococcaceae bacterium]
MRRLLLVALALAACKDDPKPVTAAGYTFTVAGWDVNTSKTEHVQTVKFEAFSEDSACMFQVVDVPDVTGESLEKEFLAEFKGHDPVAASLDTPLGKFTGHRFDGKVPEDSTAGKIAQLAGTPHVQVITLRDGKNLLAFTITYFGDERDGKKSAQRCSKMLSTITRSAQ